MKKICKTMLLILIVILATISVTFFVTNKFHEQELYSASGVLEQVKDISELNTVEMYFNEIIDFKNAKLFNNFQIPFTEKSFIFTVKSKVKAGVDLSSIDEGDIAISGKSLLIQLPNPTITSKEILSYKVYDEKNGLLWCLFGIYSIIPTPQIFLQDSQLYLVYNYITQSLLFLLITWFIKDINYRVILFIITSFNLVNLFVFLYPNIFPSVTLLFIFTTNRIYFETLLCLVNYKTNKKTLQIISIFIIGLSYIGV